MKVLIEIPEKWSDKTDVPTAEEWEEIVMSGQPLPDDCEILTKEAYSDLCMRASKGNCSEIPTGSTTKNDLGIDCISRQLMYDLGATCIATRNGNGKLIALGAIEELPSVTPQEPFINKPCVSSGVCGHDKNKVLDKIRAEIQDIAFDWQEIDGEHESFMVVDLNDALNIIDKYKAESENI